MLSVGIALQRNQLFALVIVHICIYLRFVKDSLLKLFGSFKKIRTVERFSATFPRAMKLWRLVTEFMSSIQPLVETRIIQFDRKIN